MDNQTRTRRNNIIMIVAAVVLVVLLAILLVVNMMSGDNGVSEENVVDNGVAENIGDDEGVVISFRNMDFLNSLLGETGGVRMLNQINQVVTAEAVGSGTFTAMTEGSSFTETIYFPYTVHGFMLEVSDGREYNIQVAMNGDMYYGVVIKRMGAENGSLYITFLQDGDMVGYSRESVINGLRNWAKSIVNGELLLTTEDIY